MTATITIMSIPAIKNRVGFGFESLIRPSTEINLFRTNRRMLVEQAILCLFVGRDVWQQVLRINFRRKRYLIVRKDEGNILDNIITNKRGFGLPQDHPKPLLFPFRKGL